MKKRQDKKTKQKNAFSSFFKGIFEPADENEIDFFDDEPDDGDVINLFDDGELEELDLSPAEEGESATHTEVPAVSLPGEADTLGDADSSEEDFWSVPAPSSTTLSASPDTTAPSRELQSPASAATSDLPHMDAGFFIAHNQAPARKAVSDISESTVAEDLSSSSGDIPAPDAGLSRVEEDGKQDQSEASPAIPATAAPVDESSAEPAEPAAPIGPTLHGTAAYKRPQRVSSGEGYSRTLRSSNGSMRINFRETESSRKNDVIRERARVQEETARLAKEAKQKKKKKKRLSFLKETVLNIIFIGLIVVGVLVALWYTFLLREVVVSGNERYTASDIAEMSGLKLGTHMLFCDLDAAETNVAADPYLQVDDVEYIFPARVRIRVTERKEAAAIVGLDYNVIIDHNGYVLSMGSADTEGLLKVTGISMSGFQVGQRIGQTTDYSTAALVSIITALENYDLTDSISIIDMTTPLAVTMTADSGLKIFLGQTTDLEEKVFSLYKILPSLTNSGIKTGTLYLSAKGGAVYSPVNTGATVTAEATTGSDTDADAVSTEEYTVPTYEETPVATPQPAKNIEEDAFQG